MKVALLVVVAMVLATTEKNIDEIQGSLFPVDSSKYQLVFRQGMSPVCTYDVGIFDTLIKSMREGRVKIY